MDRHLKRIWSFLRLNFFIGLPPIGSICMINYLSASCLKQLDGKFKVLIASCNCIHLKSIKPRCHIPLNLAFEVPFFEELILKMHREYVHYNV